MIYEFMGKEKMGMERGDGRWQMYTCTYAFFHFW
jgi:hypothetical protein